MFLALVVLLKVRSELCKIGHGDHLQVSFTFHGGVSCYFCNSKNRVKKAKKLSDKENKVI